MPPVRLETAISRIKSRTLPLSLSVPEFGLAGFILHVGVH